MKILKNSIRTVLGIALLLFSSCSEEDSLATDPFVVAFESSSTNLLEIIGETSIPLVYSETAFENGSFVIQVNAINAVYGVDFETIPSADNHTITIPIIEGDSENTLVFRKLNPALDETTSIELIISEINYTDSYIQGNTTFLISDTASLGGSIEPVVGGPNEGNQVFVDLSSQTTTEIQRDSWDLGFYGGDSFRVSINTSIYMATKLLDETNIDAVTEADVSDLFSVVAVGTFDVNNVEYIDHPNGNILETAIAEISETDANNKVYLVNLGYEVGTTVPTTGSVAVAGNHRGWKKIRILKEGTNYILQYADLNDTTHEEITISKNTDFNFTSFSFNSNSIVNVAPEKEKWDLCFTVFTNIINGAGSYGFSDGVLHNRKGEVVAYSVNTDAIDYDDFSAANVVSANFQQDQRAIGSSWRDVINEDKVLIDTIFYIIKDLNGNIYKLKFTALLNENGERGFPEFKYKLL